MSITHLIKEKLLKSRIHTRITFKILILVYLMFLIIWQLTAPTNAYFSNTAVHHVTLVAAGAFEAEIADNLSQDTLIDEQTIKPNSDNHETTETNEVTTKKNNIEENKNQKSQNQQTSITEEESKKTEPNETVKLKEDENKTSNEQDDLDGKQNEQDDIVDSKNN